MIARATSLAAAGLALTVLGCGSSRTATVTVTTPATSSTQAVATASPASTTAVPSSTSTSTSSTPTPTPPAPIVHAATFKSPSGNIGCMIIDGTARCDIRQRTWSPPPRPPSCPNVVDFGQGLIVAGAGLGRLVCAGDTTLDPAAQVLPYGTDTVAGGFRCASATSGMTCTSTRTGHGFFIAIQGYRVF